MSEDEDVTPDELCHAHFGGDWEPRWGFGCVCVIAQAARADERHKIAERVLASHAGHGITTELNRLKAATIEAVWGGEQE